METKISTEVKQIESEYENGYINILDGLTFSQWKTIRMCEFYSNSKYIGNGNGVNNANGASTMNRDELGRDAPFYNIVNFRVTIAKVATDLDIKDVNVESDDPQHYVKAMLLRKESYKWMKESDFGQFLNRMGYTRAKYGGVLVKKTEDDDEKGALKLECVQWKNVVTDQVQIMDNPIVEKHYMTYAQLLKKKDVWKNVTEVLERQGDMKTAKKYGVTEISNRICVYEVKGEFPEQYLKQAQDKDYTDDDRWQYSLQQYYIADVYGKSFVMYADTLKEMNYKYLAWEEMEGRGLGRGVIEDSEEAQVWTNDAIKNEKNAMDLAGKVVLKTTAKKLGNNILEIDNGKIFELDDGKELDVLNLAPAALGEFQTQLDRWKVQADGATSSFDANTGETPPSGTPYSQTALLNQIASKPFDYRREEAGIFVSELFDDWIMPYLIKKLKKGHILVSDFTEDELNMIDQDFAVDRANTKVKENLLKGEYTSPEQYQALIQAEKLLGTKRYLEIPDGYFDDIEASVTIDPTGEMKNKQAVLQSLSTIMGDVVKSYNPQTGKFGVFEDPRLSRLFGSIVELSGVGISPASLGIGAKNAQGAATAQGPQTIQPQPSPVQANPAPVA